MKEILTDILITFQSLHTLKIPKARGSFDDIMLKISRLQKGKFVIFNDELAINPHHIISVEKLKEVKE